MLYNLPDNDGQEAFFADLQANAQAVSAMSMDELNDWMVARHCAYYWRTVRPMRYISTRSPNDILTIYRKAAIRFLT